MAHDVGMSHVLVISELLLHLMLPLLLLVHLQQSLHHSGRPTAGEGGPAAIVSTIKSCINPSPLLL